MDRFRVDVIAQALNPQQVIYAALHQDYNEGFVVAERGTWPNEETSGNIIVKRLLAGERGHYGPLEHAHIVLNCGFFPHSVIQQARTHRVGVSFDVQSFRFQTGGVLAVAAGTKPVEEVFYLRPVGHYSDRQGKRYFYSPEQRQGDLVWCLEAAKRYRTALELGCSEEHARGLLPFDYRQHFVVSFNVRSLMHFLDLRYKANAQLEIQKLCDLMMPHFRVWVPAIAEWYETTRLGKARLAP